MRKVNYILLPLLLIFIISCIEPFEDPPRTEQVPVMYIKSVSIHNHNVKIKVAYFVPESCWEFVRNEIKHNGKIYHGFVYARRITDEPCSQKGEIYDTEFIFLNLRPGTYTFEFDSYEEKIDTTISVP